MRLARAVLVSVAMVLMTMPAFSVRTSADGMMYTHTDIYDEWGLVKERTQYSVIGYHDGVQRMVISIRILPSDLSSADKAVWLFPVPSAPEKASIGIVDQVRELEGKRMASMAQDSMTNDAMFLSATQFYPLIFWVPIYMSSGNGGTLASKEGPEGYGDVEVVQSVAKYGITTELIGANRSDGLSNYLAGKGLGLPSASLPIVDEYIGHDYSFVASWISNLSEFQSSAPIERDRSTAMNFYNLGVMISFPTNRIYYPLRLTSVYGSTSVPMVVQVIGLVNPIRSTSSFHGKGMSVDYLQSQSITVRRNDSKIYDPDIGTGFFDYVNLPPMKYTEIVINTTSDKFTDDLWIDPSPSLQANMLDVAIDHSWMVSVPLFVLASMLASMVSGVVVYRGFQPKVGMFALMGLFNFLTIIGVLIAAMKLDISHRFNGRGVYASPEVSSYVAAFTVLFMMFAIVIFGLFIGYLSL